MIQLLIETQAHHRSATSNDPQLRTVLKDRRGGARPDRKRMRVFRGARRFVHPALVLT
ncbi:hypothetical protein [Bradyrhizobium sp. AUGA SZCCT0431]|uniref:hypothetical protein n=1 Tax=Bradyrhizobium sp. AUGA SZCCT0431 TaxID=2807674 RepID=UPI0020112737|nr:hypothetical protein [Bradyrhizobium sp. AUGA SZCCT0431]